MVLGDELDMKAEVEKKLELCCRARYAGEECFNTIKAIAELPSLESHGENFESGLLKEFGRLREYQERILQEMERYYNWVLDRL